MNLKKFFQFYLNLHLAGVGNMPDDEVGRRISFSNVVFITLPVVYFLFMLLDYKTFTVAANFERFDVFIVPITILVCYFCLWLNIKSHTSFSRIVFLFFWPMLMHLVPIIIQETPSDYYLALPIGIIFHAILIQLMFAHNKEAWLFWLFLGLNFLSLLMFPQILSYFASSAEPLNPLLNDPYYRLDAILYWLLFNLVTFYVLKVIEQYIVKVNNSKVLIEQQKEELAALNETLENKVWERTVKLEKHNQILRNYSFFNAHKLRAPFCRIQGLIQLMEHADATEGKIDTEIHRRLNESVSEMDEVITRIRQIVDAEQTDFDDRFPDSAEKS